MFYNFKNYLIHFENNLSRFLVTSIGEEADFNVDHRLFNCVCLIVASTCVLRIFINFILGVKLFEVTLNNIFTFLIILSIFCISRFLKKLVLCRFMFVIVILISFSFTWYFSNGSEGAMPFYYFSLLVILAFISLRRFKVLVVCIILANAALLIILEYRHPHMIIQKLEGHKLFLYKYVHMLFVALITIVIIQTGKKFYKTDKKTITELNKNFQDQPGSEENSIPEIYLNLTSQERKVLEHIQKGKRNKEIASVLNVDISTVKTHINNIYKKKGIHSRTGLLNNWN